MSRFEDDASFITMSVEDEKEKLLIVKSFTKLIKKESDVGKEGINTIFYQLMQEYPKQLFEVVYVIAEETDQRVDQVFKCLDNDNRGKLKNYAMNFYNTGYYEKKELEKRKKKMERSGKKFDIRKNIEDLFE